MKRLLSIELQKIWQNRSSKILVILYFAVLSFIALIASIEIEIGPIKLYFADMGIFNFPYIWHFNTYIAAFFKIFLAVVIVSMMANEYSYGTLKQNLIDGMSKKEFILSKFYTILFFAFISTAFVFSMSLVLGYSFSAFNEIGIVFSDLSYLVAYFIKLTAFFTFCLFLGLLIRKSAFALGFLFVWFIGENISYGILGRFVFNDFDTAYQIKRFYPLEAMNNLIVEPWTRLKAVKTISSQIGEEITKQYDVTFTNVLIVIGWTLIFLFLSYYIVKKRDL
ncbi:MAG: hypothetical protein RLY43_1852 [Bacteroidota bacterium]|jgi:ABC-type transport system involved in multi-copper enzyme maturation permease subunit